MKYSNRDPNPPRHSPTVDGEELPDGYGVLFERDTIDYYDQVTGAMKILPGPSIRAWVTRRDYLTREYKKHVEVTNRTVRVWDEQERAWEYDNGVLTIIESDLDMDELYGDK